MLPQGDDGDLLTAGPKESQPPVDEIRRRKFLVDIGDGDVVDVKALRRDQLASGVCGFGTGSDGTRAAGGRWLGGPFQQKLGASSQIGHALLDAAMRNDAASLVSGTSRASDESHRWSTGLPRSAATTSVTRAVAMSRS